uniref:ATP synthase subunit a n=1 Tax=Polydora cf. ciliata DS-2023 TaxID=3033393 RepID=A0AA95EKD6_9ANNE|nr:ATPase subunit 6 [Polydora cf. ciliata DS-2023]
MLMDLFSTFDPATYKIYNTFPASWWFMNFSHLLILMPTLFTGGSRFNSSIRLYMGYLIHWLDSKQISHMKGMTLILASSITLTLSTNMIGQLPYTYPITVSPVFSMTLCLPIWFGAITSSLIYAPTHFLAGLIPLSTPLVLTPIVTTAELMSNLVRPISHCARLTINTTLGHLYLKLAASFSMYSLASSNGLSLTTFILLSLTIMLIFFEVIIALLQSYIYCFLLTIYITDHPHISLPIQNKAVISISKQITNESPKKEELPAPH